LLAPEVGGDTFAWVVDAYDILAIHRLQVLQELSLHLEGSQHLPQHFTWHNIEHLFEVHKIEIEWFLFCLVLFY
jgi:hypothetical protein